MPAGPAPTTITLFGVAALVAAWIGAGYWFTASTSFANPAAAFGRMWSDSFAGIAPASGRNVTIERIGWVVTVISESLPQSLRAPIQ